MNKKVLSALLFGALFAGTGTFTSCIDNDEPAGIEEIRGAKAELIKAQAAFELAEEAWMRAQVANQELVNKAKELENKRYEIETELSEIAVELKKLELERAQASTEQHKAEAEAKIAEAKRNQAYWENQMALEAEQFKTNMLNAQKWTMEAQAALDKAIAEAELAKLTMSEAEKETVQAAIDYVANAADILGQKHNALIQAQKNFDNALFNEAGGQSLSKLTAELNKKNAALNVQNVLLQETKDMLELAKNFDKETWSAQMKQLDADVQEAEKNKGEAEVAVTKIQVGAEYQKADDAYVLAVNTLGEQEATKGEIDETSYEYNETSVTTDNVEGRGSQYQAKNEFVLDSDGNPTTQKTLAGKYVAAYTDSVAAMDGSLTIAGEANATNFALEGYSSNEIPAALENLLAVDPVFSGTNALSGYNSGVFSYGVVGTDEYYTEGDYQEDLKTIEEKGEDLKLSDLDSKAAIYVKTVEDWIAALKKFSPDANAQEWQKFLLEEAKEKQKTAVEAYNAAKAAWEILVDAKKNDKLTVAPTDYSVKNGVNANFKKAVADYNTAYDNLATAITNHNTALDAWKAAEDEFKTTTAETYKTDTKNEEAEFEVLVRYEAILGGTAADFDYVASGLDKATAMSQYTALTSTMKSLAQYKLIVNNNVVATGSGATAKTKEQNAAAIFAGVDAFAANKINVKYADATNKKTLDDAAASHANAQLTAEYAKAADKSTLVAKKLAVTSTHASDATKQGTAQKVTLANDALVAAWATTATGNVKSTYNEYVKRLAGVYGQAVTAKNLVKLSDDAADAAGQRAYVTYATADPYTYTINWNYIQADFGYAATSYTNLKKADGTEEAAIIEGYKKYQAAGSKISDAELANLSVTELHDGLVDNALESTSHTLFGTNFDTTGGEPRLLPVTEAEVKAHANADVNNPIDINETNYGKLGAKMEADAAVQLYTDMEDIEKVVTPIITEFEAHLTALKAEIAANSAIVAEYVKAADDAWTAVLAGRTAVDAALVARDAISSEAEAKLEEYTALALELKAVRAEAESQLTKLAPATPNPAIQGEWTVEKLIVWWEVKVVEAEAKLENLKSEIAKVEKAIELFEAGNYDEAYNVALYKGWLETAQKEYDAAYAVYEAAAKQLDAVIEALLK